MLELLNKRNDSLLVFSDFSKSSKNSQTKLHAEKETG